MVSFQGVPPNIDALPTELQVLILQDLDIKDLAATRKVSRSLKKAVDATCQHILVSFGLDIDKNSDNFLRIKALFDLVDRVKQIPDDKKIPGNLRKVAAFFREHVQARNLASLVEAFNNQELKTCVFKGFAIYDHHEGRRIKIGQFNSDIFSVFLNDDPAAADASTLVYNAIGNLELSVASLDPRSVAHFLLRDNNITSDRLNRCIKLLAKRYLPKSEYHKRVAIFEHIAQFLKTGGQAISTDAWEDIMSIGDVHCLLAIEPELLGAESLQSARWRDCWTPVHGGLFHMAASANDTGILDVLIRTAPEAINDLCGHRELYTPLHAAVAGGCFDVVCFLVESGADLSVPTHLGYTPLDLAIASCQIEIADYLIDKTGGRISTKTKKDREKLAALLADMKVTHKKAVDQHKLAENRFAQGLIFDEVVDNYDRMLDLLSTKVGKVGKVMIMAERLPRTTRRLLRSKPQEQTTAHSRPNGNS